MLKLCGFDIIYRIKYATQTSNTSNILNILEYLKYFKHAEKCDQQYSNIVNNLNI